MAGLTYNQVMYHELRELTRIPRQERRGLPEWIEIMEGEEYCTLCRAYATDGHLLSGNIKCDAFATRQVATCTSPILI